MKSFLFIIIGLVITGIVLLLCFCFCFLASKSDDYWDELKLKMEKRNGRE